MKPDIFDRIWKRKFSFLITFFIVFSVTYGILFAIDFLPEEPSEEAQAEEIMEDTESIEENPEENIAVEEPEPEPEPEVTVVTGELPLSIGISKLDKEIEVLNPTSRTIADLDAALLEGVVRHPDSATLAQDGNVFILGHSSYLPNVLNPNFQAFNGIQDLDWGDTITLTSADAVFEYRVEKVYEAKASGLTVPIAGEEKRLIIATCDSFGSVDDRYIVEAKQVKVTAL